MNSKSVRFAVMFIFVAIVPAWANKSSVELVVPKTAKTGDTITVTLQVSHRGNNFLHHTMWACLRVNGEEVGRWEWKSKHFESGNFSRQVRVQVSKDLSIEGEASCNFHGSAGKQQATVKVQ